MRPYILLLCVMGCTRPNTEASIIVATDMATDPITTSDLGTDDLSQSPGDLATNDLAMSDLAVGDMVTTDMAGSTPHDFAMAQHDLAIAQHDLALPLLDMANADLASNGPDLSVANDMTSPPDLTMPADLTYIYDMTIAPHSVGVGGICNDSINCAGYTSSGTCFNANTICTDVFCVHPQSGGQGTCETGTYNAPIQPGCFSNQGKVTFSYQGETPLTCHICVNTFPISGGTVVCVDGSYVN